LQVCDANELTLRRANYDIWQIAYSSLSDLLGDHLSGIVASGYLDGVSEPSYRIRTIE